MCLRHIDIVERAAQMVDTLGMFGNLGHLTALHTLSHFLFRFGTEPDMTEEMWLDLDKVLLQARDTLQKVEIYAHMDEDRQIPPALDLLRNLLPSVAQKMSVYPTDDEEYE
jgi:hypothetical protein